MFLENIDTNIWFFHEVAICWIWHQKQKDQKTISWTSSKFKYLLKNYYEDKLLNKLKKIFANNVFSQSLLFGVNNWHITIKTRHKFC